MYERFTDRARKVMHLANQEAQRFHHEYIGTEHILLGIIKEGWGTATGVLKSLGVDLRKIRSGVEQLLGVGPAIVFKGKLPQTPRAKKVIKYSMEEACNLEHMYVGTEHILLGLLREQEGVAAQVLMNLGLKLGEVREEVINLLKRESNTPEEASAGTRGKAMLNPIRIDRYGNTICSYADGSIHQAGCCGLHGTCGGAVERRVVSDKYAILSCRMCNWHTYIPINVETWQELENWASEQYPQSGH